MPVKVLLMIRRRPDLTPEEFREAYEGRHSRLALRLFGHLWTEYRRNYLGSANSFAAQAGTPTEDRVAEATCPYDVITEMVFRDMGSLEHMNQIASLPENQQQLAQDEEALFDRARSWTSVCEIVEEDLRNSNTDRGR